MPAPATPPPPHRFSPPAPDALLRNSERQRCGGLFSRLRYTPRLMAPFSTRRLQRITLALIAYTVRIDARPTLLTNPLHTFVLYTNVVELTLPFISWANGPLPRRFRCDNSVEP